MLDELSWWQWTSLRINDFNYAVFGFDVKMSPLTLVNETGAFGAAVLVADRTCRCAFGQFTLRAEQRLGRCNDGATAIVVGESH